MTIKPEKRMEVETVILGGGRGTRLYPLTRDRSKPAVPLAGKYRLIDVALSNCINSNLRRIHVVTQFNSASLNRHVSDTYRFDHFSRGFVEILAAEQTAETEQWYQGTADAVRRNLHHVLGPSCTHVLILPGDALYRMDFRELLAKHEKTGAEITVCCQTVAGEDASAFGILAIDAGSKVTKFHEKPAQAQLEPLRMPPGVLVNSGRPFLASMGIYLFNRDVLTELLTGTTAEDFGKQIIPQAVSAGRVHAHLFDGYWEDIGTIRNFFRANLSLVGDQKHFNFHDAEAPMYTRPRVLPSTEVTDSKLDHVVVAEGCLIQRAQVTNSVLGIRSMVRKESQLRNVVMMGADYYESSANGAQGDRVPPLGIGPGCIIENAIIDKNARIGAGCSIRNAAGVDTSDGPNFAIRDGVVVITKNAIVPDGTVI
ncbi:MAG: glucose-1-phosphate adenylyltransferase [Candidatus Sumerlaeaceae bacterium]|nr:glucose-1-phosphate adenylyltransferase [Candidatus Sumerlaeaceae bacterium]